MKITLKTELAFALLAFLCCSYSFCEDLNSENALASALIAAQTEPERAALLNTYPQLVTIELRKILISEGEKLKISSSFPKALSAFELGRTVAEKINDKTGVVESLINIGIVTRILGNNQQALEKMNQSLSIAEELKDQSLISKSLLYVGVIHSYMGDYDVALDYFKKSFEHSDLLTEKDLALLLNNIGVTNMFKDNYDEALPYLHKALEIRKKLNDKNAIGASFNNIAI
ncbi:MAG TPA: tetratricopeptide repeat protein, partial [Acidobacteriota bacterium]